MLVQFKEDVLKQKEIKVTPDMIRKKFKSVMAFARYLNVSRGNVYDAIRGKKYLDKLRKRIYEALDLEVEK